MCYDGEKKRKENAHDKRSRSSDSGAARGVGERGRGTLARGGGMSGDAVSHRDGSAVHLLPEIGQNGQPNRELLIDRREKSKTLSWSSVCLAFRRAREIGYADRPKALGDIRGVSYVYPLMWRFGVLRVPEIVEKNMSLTLDFGFFAI